LDFTIFGLLNFQALRAIGFLELFIPVFIFILLLGHVVSSLDENNIIETGE